MRGTFERGVPPDALRTFRESNLAPRLDQREQALQNALVELYQTLDDQLQTIERAKKKLPQEGAQNPSDAPPHDFYPSPVGMDGQPVVGSH